MKYLAFLFSLALLLVINNGCQKAADFASIYGVISDYETGEPIINAVIMLSPVGKTKTTGIDGRYEFSELDPQQYTITVQKTGYQTNRKTVTVVVNDAAEANIPLTKK